MAETLKVINELIGDNAALSVAVAFLVYIGTQFVLAHFKHRADRRAYRYDRSSSTGKMRFEKESFHIEQLSSALLALVTATESLAERDAVRLTSSEKDLWLEAHRSCVARLGAAAPFVNYRNPADGTPYCGVQHSCDDGKTAAAMGEGGEGTNDEQAGRLGAHLDGRGSKSLYLRAALLVDACRTKMTKFGGLAVGTVLAPNLFCADEVNGELPVPGRELELAARYERFVNCAACRLRDCEKGSKDARWQRVKDWFASKWKKPFANTYHFFDASCPYSELHQDKSKKAICREIITAIALTVALVALVVVLIVRPFW